MKGKADAARLLDFLCDGDLNSPDDHNGPRSMHTVGYCQALSAYAEAKENDEGLRT